MPERSDRLFIRGLAVFARHGVHPAEAELGQRFNIDLTLELDTSEAGAHDDYSRTVCYGDVYTAVRAIAETERFKLIEALAEAIAARLLADFPRLTAVEIEIRKPSAPIAGIFDTVGLSIRRARRAT
ncbi:dihydroneopterin aldolase [Amorphus sp. 3PC139-8]|uniref:dihydroneopterin aldolase n=1 Tax=Amorphus sp. 3PC139-8 TaxID=2735676 RepID=UPI00345D3398